MGWLDKCDERIAIGGVKKFRLGLWRKLPQSGPEGTPMVHAVLTGLWGD